MTTRERPADRGRRTARAAARRVGGDIRDARVGGGLSQRFVAENAGVSRSHFGRLERGEVLSPSTDFLASCCAVVGLELALRTYPRGDPLRDRGQRALLDRLRRVIHPGLVWRTEVPLPIEGDLRAWDSEVRGRGWLMHVEAETRLSDGQALERRVALKIRDGGPGHVMLLVADTRANRSAIAALRSGLRETFPLDSRAVLAALRQGRDPGASGLVIL